MAKVVAPRAGDGPGPARDRAAGHSASPKEVRFPIFEPDLGRLAKRGFAIPSQAAPSICGEIRVIKRRLLRRLNFLHRDNWDGSGQAGACPLVLVTSSEPEEGKTFLAANLALSLAMEEGVKVLLVDGDLIKPSLADLFELGLRLGLGDSFSDPAIPPHRIINCAVQMPLGVVTAGRNTGAFAGGLIGGSLRGVLDVVAVAFGAHVVIIDGPPILATTEAAILAEQVDELVFVVRADATPAHRVSAALDLLSGEDRISLVLNRAPFTQKTPKNYRNYEPGRSSS